MNNTLNSTHSTKTDQFNPMPSIEEGTIVITRHWQTIKRHKSALLRITIICLIIGVLAVLMATPIYKAESTLLAEPVQPSLDNRQVNSALVFLFYQTQYEIISSLNIAQKAVDKVGLVERYKAKQALGSGTTEEGLTNYIQLAKSWLSIYKEQEAEPSDEELRVMLARDIQKRLLVGGGKQSKIVLISYEDRDPQLAADIVNAIAEAYIEFGLESRLSVARQTSTWFNEQLKGLKDKLHSSEDTLQAFQKSQGMVDTSQQEQLAGTRLTALTAELTRIQANRVESEIRYKQIRNKYKSGDYASLSQLLNNRVILDQEQAVRELSRRVQELSERYGEKHPKLIAARADRDEAKQNLKIEYEQIVESVHKEYLTSKEHEKKLIEMINEEKKDVSALKGNVFQLARLENEVLNNRTLYESFINRFQTANASEQYDASNIHIVDVAGAPDKPFKPNKPLYIIIALLLGLLMGSSYAFLREHLDATFKTTEDLEDKLKLPVLGVIPIVRNAKNTTSPESQVMTDSRSQFAENVNNIRTGLLFSEINKPPQTIMVTSATANEGKSTLAINLAASFSQLDKTLLIEVDMRKPSIAKYLNINSSPGIADVLRSIDMPNDVLVKIGDENCNLYVIPAGSPTLHPLEMLTSGNFIRMLEELKKEFTYIVLDSPPVLAVSDAIVVGQIVDSVVLSVKAESTRVPIIKESINRLKKSNVHVSGTVLSQVDVKRMNYYGTYYDASYSGYQEAASEET